MAITFRLAFALTHRLYRCLSLSLPGPSPSLSPACCSSGAPSALWGKINIKMEASASILGRIAMQAVHRYPRYPGYILDGGMEIGGGVGVLRGAGAGHG